MVLAKIIWIGTVLSLGFGWDQTLSVLIATIRMSTKYSLIAVIVTVSDIALQGGK